MKIDFTEATGQPLDTRALSAGGGVLYPFTFSNDGRHLACLGGDCPVWECSTGAIAYKLDPANIGDGYPIFSPSDRLLAACCPQSIDVCEHPANKLSHSFSALDGRGDYVRKLMFAQDESLLVFLSDFCVQCWSISENQEVANYRLGEREHPIDVAQTNEGLLLYSAHLNDAAATEFCVTDVLRQRRLSRIELGTNCALSPIVSADGTLLLLPTRGAKPCYQVWDIRERQRLCDLPETPGLFQEDNLLLGSTYYVNCVLGTKLWDVRAARLLRRVDLIHEHNIKVTYSSATGLFAATWNSILPGQDRTLFIDSITGDVLGEARGHTWEGRKFSACGRWFASVVDENFLIDRGDDRTPCGTVLLTDLSSILPSDSFAIRAGAL